MSRHAVAILIHDDVQALDVAGPIDVLGEANTLIDRDDGYEIVVIARERKPTRASSGLTFLPDADLSDERLFTTVLVAGGPSLPDARPDAATSSWLRERAARARRHGSICTGAFVLGHAGLLDEKTVTTHWQNAHRLAKMFPKARVEDDRIFLRDGALVTSAGVTAGIDLALALVAEDHGAAIALACAKRLVVVAQRQGGQSQFSPFLLPLQAVDSPLAKVQSYVMAHPKEAFPVERLASIANVSPRSIARMFVSEWGVTPHEFVENARIDNARSLLEATDLALKAVAYDCGFATAEQMRLVFQRRLNTTPARYREHFKAR